MEPNEEPTKEQQSEVAEQVEQVEEQEHPAEGTTEASAEEQLESKQEQTEESGAKQTEQPKTYKLKHKGQEIEVSSEEELLALANKGLDYTKKTQALSEVEKALSAQAEQQKLLASNPNAVKLLLAQQANIDPKYLFLDIPQPHPELQQIDPQGYAQAWVDYQMGVKAKETIGNMLNVMLQNQAQQQNGAIIQRARLKYVEDGEVGETQFNEMIEWAKNHVRPNTDGVYPSDTLDVAYKYLYGDKQMANEKLKISENIQKNLKEAVKAKPATAVNKRVEKPAKSAESDFLNFVSKKDNKGGYYD